MGPVIEISADFWLPKPSLLTNPSASESGAGYASLAVFAIYLVLATLLLIAEQARTAKAIHWSGRVDILVAFLVASIAFFVFRIVSILVNLNVSRLYDNMAAVMVLEMIGNSLCLLAFTLIAITWTKVLSQPGRIETVMKVLRYLLYVGWVVVTCCLFAFMVWFCAVLGRNFGVGVHDDVFVVDGGNRIIVTCPLNNTLIKPQSGIILANVDLHHAYMAEKGMYAVYGWLLAFVFVTLSAAILVTLRSVQSVSSSRDPKNFFRLTFKILVVAFVVMLTFTVIIVAALTELVFHRHGLRWEYYVSNYVCAELIAFGVLLDHFWMTELRTRAQEREGTSGSRKESNTGSSRKDSSPGFSQDPGPETVPLAVVRSQCLTMTSQAATSSEK